MSRSMHRLRTGTRLSRVLHRRVSRSRSDDGAAAVEFALVLPVLVLILFGIIDYGLYFSNSIGARSGVQDAVRQAVVGNYDAGCTIPTAEQHDYDVEPPASVVPAPGPSSDVGALICMVKSRTQPISGETFVKVILPTNPGPNADPSEHGWFVGGSLTVCEVVEAKGLTGYVPLPRSGTNSNGVIRDKVVMQIEQHTPDPDTGYDDSASVAELSPPGGWGDSGDPWCLS